MNTKVRDLTLTHESRLEALSGFGGCVRFDLGMILNPYTDGRTQDGRTEALKAATAEMLDAVDRLATQAKTDLALLKSAGRADRLNHRRHERAEQGMRV